MLRLVSISYTDVRITRLVSHVLGNLALDETSHKEILQKGEPVYIDRRDKNRFLNFLHVTES